MRYVLCMFTSTWEHACMPVFVICQQLFNWLKFQTMSFKNMCIDDLKHIEGSPILAKIQ